MSLFQARSSDFAEVQIESSEEECIIDQEMIFHILSEFSNPNPCEDSVQLNSNYQITGESFLEYFIVHFWWYDF